ncbi:asparagine synthase (glutamine-hydrolyzing) [Halobaculum lipolyticum]|uniref:Putative asparagine synthetase [glutamine-hydrolyzing] n=1 Tax=Halobaculum lipolyticum TaxID=3032001 RepID=A0ABD5WBT5_9EURY|nr:asparagine synthase (glutamine-hydrolyzing) [Halobaculum sp. DT31]
MCGIWGYVGATDSIDVADAWNGLCALTDRGPDAWGMYVDGHGRVTDEASLPDGESAVAIGNRRLSILDLSAAGTQPMEYDGSWIVYNGEVYNYREIREDLRDLGHEFDSDSDTEVILHAYEEYGSACVERLRGMFAFVVFDADADRLFAARDRFGIKPFYYSHTDGRFSFASEVTSLLDGGVVERTVDPVSVDGFLTFGYVPGPRTIVAGVRSLPPASTLTYDRSTGDLDVERYWTPSFDSSDPETDLRDLLEETVSLRLRSDVPVGAFLSGGLDSSTIVALMREVSAGDRDDLHTFSVGFESDTYDESAFAETVAERFGTDHTSTVVGPADVRARLDDVVASMDQPTIDGVNTYFVSQAAADAGLKVTLSGLGSDELFFGYPTFETVARRYRAAKRLQTIPRPVRNAGGELLSRLGDAVDDHTIEAAGDAVAADSAFGAAYLSARGLFSRRARSGLLPETDRVRWDEHVGESVSDLLGATDDRNVVSDAELGWYMRDQLLRQTDSMSMAHSLEVRVPFLDVPLAEHVMGLDADDKAVGEKALLKDAVSDLLPLDVIEREKTGFTFPFAEWLRDDLSDVVTEATSADRLAATPIDAAAAADVRDQFLAGDRHWSRVWALTVLSLWMDEHLLVEDR